MDSGGLASRLQHVADQGAPESLRQFDASNENHVDEVARHLLERFRSQDDVEAYQLLFEVVQPRLSQLAAQIARRLSPAADPDDLVSGFMARIFTDVRNRPNLQVRHFLALAYTSMRNDVLDQLRHQKRAQAHSLDYSQTLRAPADPADAVQTAEQDEIYERLGSEVLRITSECFGELDDRDQQVLIAREIVRLPYDRVAAMLKLAPDQVGMVIRRARMHLADRIVHELVALTSSDTTDVAPEDARILRDSVVAGLESSSRAKNVKTLVEHMLGQAAHAAKSKLANLLYEMAKACLVEAPQFNDRILVEKRPRPSDIVAGELMHLRSRLVQVDPDGTTTAEVEDVASTRPRANSAIGDARRCLTALAGVEGESGRHQVAVALAFIYDGAPADAEPILRGLQDADLPEPTRRNVSRNLTLSLLRQDRYGDALQCAEAAADEWPDDPARVMNLCFASARLGDEARFETYVGVLCNLQRQHPEDSVARWIDKPLRALARDLGLANDTFTAMLGDVLDPDLPGADEDHTAGEPTP